MNLFIFCSLLITLKYVESVRMTIVDRCDVCFSPKDAPYVLHKFDLRIEKHHQFYVSASAEVTEVLGDKDLEVNIRLTRCASREQLDTCELFTILRPPMSVCSFISIPNSGVRKIMNMFTPPIKCPIFGNYSTTNLTYNIDSITIVPLGSHYWKVEANGFYKKRLVGTICLDFIIKGISVH